MAKFNKIKVMSEALSTGVVPVFYHPSVEVSKSVMKACYDGGIRVFEFTNRGDFAHEIFVELSKYAAAELPEMILGAGSVVDAPTAALFLQEGANFIVGPLFNPEIARVCNRRCVPYIPGCGSVSEIGQSQEAGCDMCKVFPGDVLGTGGVEPEYANLESWFKAGASVVGMGSNLFPKAEIERQDWQSIKMRCSECLQMIKTIREK